MGIKPFGKLFRTGRRMSTKTMPEGVTSNETETLDSVHETSHLGVEGGDIAIVIGYLFPRETANLFRDVLGKLDVARLVDTEVAGMIVIWPVRR